MKETVIILNAGVTVDDTTFKLQELGAEIFRTKPVAGIIDCKTDLDLDEIMSWDGVKLAKHEPCEEG